MDPHDQIHAFVHEQLAAVLDAEDRGSLNVERIATPEGRRYTVSVPRHLVGMIVGQGGRTVESVRHLARLRCRVEGIEGEVKIRVVPSC